MVRNNVIRYMPKISTGDAGLRLAVDITDTFNSIFSDVAEKAYVCHIKDYEEADRILRALSLREEGHDDFMIELNDNMIIAKLRNGRVVEITASEFCWISSCGSVIDLDSIIKASED